MVRALHATLLMLVVVGIAAVVGFGLVATDTVDANVAITETEAGNQTVPHAPPDIDSTERLLVPTPSVETADGAPAADPGRATSMSFDQLRATYDAGILESEVGATSSSDAQITRVQDELATVEADLESTLADEEAAFASFTDGEITAPELFAEMGVLHERSQTLQYRLDHISQTVQGITSPLTQDQVRIVRGEVSQLNMEAQTIEGPIRSDSSAIVRGVEQADAPYHVHASTDGYVLSSIDNGMYTREITVLANQDRDSGSGYTNDDTARDRAANLYPWTYDQAIATESTLRGGIYWTSLDHPHGSTTMFLDGGTELSFREIHEIDLITVPTVTELETGNESLDIRVDRTYAGGPAVITATDADSEEPVADVTVQVDNQTIAQTNAEGEAWITSPPGHFELTLETGEWTSSYELAFPVGDPTVS